MFKISVLENDVLIGINGRNYKFYENLGYEIPKIKTWRGDTVKNGTKIEVKVSDLYEGCSVKVTKVCDDCGKIIPNIQYHKIIESRKNSDGKDRCRSCTTINIALLMRENVPYERSLECWAMNNNRIYVIEEYSDKNIQKASNIFKSSNDNVLWKCSTCNSEYYQSPSNRTKKKGIGCPYCAGMKVNETNNLITTHPDLVKEWHPILNKCLTPYDVTKGSHKKVWWKCSKCKLDWYSTVNQRTSNKRECPFCIDRLPIELNNLEVKDPKLVKEWNYDKNELLPTEVMVKSGKRVWWKCQKGHEWKATICSRSNGSKCPYCSGMLPTKENNLFIKFPKLCEEWGYKKNKQKPFNYLPQSNKKVWWICQQCNNEWETTIQNRTSGSGCPVCSESKGEKRVRKWLEENNFLFEPQKEFEGLVGTGGGLLSYDFYLPKQNILIEYQGEFHDGKANDHVRENLEKQKEHDRRKREYAEQNDIRLLEIWYWDYENIERILKQKSMQNKGV